MMLSIWIKYFDLLNLSGHMLEISHTNSLVKNIFGVKSIFSFFAAHFKTNLYFLSGQFLQISF